MKTTKRALSFLLFLLITTTATQAQSNQAAMTAVEQQSVVDSIASLLNRDYVFPDIAKRMSDSLTANLSKGLYASFTDPIRFSEKLTEDLRSISKDKHINVKYDPKYIKGIQSKNSQNKNANDTIPFQLPQWKMTNFGFKEVKILEGNIGYIDLRNFHSPKYARETAVAAMNLVSNSDALIFDLRKNGGGSPEMIQLISSYLFDTTPVHLNNFYFRPENKNIETWTFPAVAGKRRPDITVYVLTSKGTFSAAEEFTYNLKNLKRATIIGETTGGGANPGGTRILSDRFTIFVPHGRAINPITGTNWEGTGVQPDIEVPASEALLTAQLIAMETLAAKDTSNHQSIYPWLLRELKAQKQPIVLTEKQLKEYAGLYGTKNCSQQNGQLLYSISASRKAVLLPIETDLFKVEDTMLRVQFLRKGKTIINMQVENVSGTTETYQKEQ